MILVDNINLILYFCTNFPTIGDNMIPHTAIIEVVNVKTLRGILNSLVIGIIYRLTNALVNGTVSVVNKRPATTIHHP